MRTLSVWGLSAAFVYLAIVFAITYHAGNCNGLFCDVGVGLATLPLGIFVNGGLGSPVMFWGLILVNLLILYVFFAFLQKRMGK